MVFLNPAVLLGLIAAVIPILIHLFNLRKLKKVEFSTLLFLKELQKSKIRKIKVKQWLLLALRVLIIIFLVAAFARPTVKHFSLGSASSTAKTTAVIILDNSYSMSVIDEKGSYLNQAKKTAKELIENMQSGDEAAVIFTSDPQTEEQVLTSQKSKLISRINNTQISYVSNPLTEALIKASVLINNSQNFNKEVYILSDFQKFNLPAKIDTTEIGKSLLDKNTRVYTFTFNGKDVQNLTNKNLTVNNQIFEINKPISFTSTIKNNSKEIVPNSILSLFFNGKRKAQASVNLNPNKTKQVNFETSLKESGFLEIISETEEDDILQDNKYFVGIFVPKQISVLVASDNPDDAKYVNTALSNNLSDYIILKSIKLTQINAFNIKQFDVVIIVGSKKFGNYDRIRNFIYGGGNLILMPGKQSTLLQFNNLCKAVGLPSASGEAQIKPGTQQPMLFDKINFKHPIFSNIFQKGSKPQLDSPEIYHFFKTEPSGKGKTIISLIDKSSFLSEFQIKSGKIVLFNTAPVLSWSNFPIKGIFAPLMNKLIFYLTSKNRTAQNIVAGNKISVNLGKVILPQIKVVRPNKQVEFLNIDLEERKKFLDYGRTDLVGTYKFYSGSKLIDYAEVNINPDESILNYISRKEFEVYLNKFHFSGRIISLNANEDFRNKIYQSRFGTELWKYFLILAFLFAIIEMMISKSSKKDMDSTSIQ